MLCSTWASGGNGGSAIGIPGVATDFGSAGAVGFASLPGFASGAACAGAAGGAPPLARCATAVEEAVMGSTAKRHEKATNFGNEKDGVEIMSQILHTYQAASHNQNKYFCILTKGL